MREHLPTFSFVKNKPIPFNGDMIYPDTVQDSKSVQEHYDSLDFWYRKLWGDHLHHGLWLTGKESKEEAVEKLIELVAAKGSIKPGMSICDIGCGYGATSRYLTEKYQARMSAFSLSGRQLEYARLKDQLTCYYHQDWLENHLPSQSMDLAISIESSEHMVDKAQFFQEIYRTLKPSGKVVVCAWLSKENPKQWEIRHLLEPICREGRLPSLGSVSDYTQWMMAAGFQSIEFEDLTQNVKKTWTLSAQNMLFELKNKEFRHFLFKEKPKDRIFAKTVFRILCAYQTRSMIYGIFKADKP